MKLYWLYIYLYLIYFTLGESMKNRSRRMRVQLLLLSWTCLVSWQATAKGQQSAKAYKLNGKTVTVDQVAEENRSTFYEVEKKKYPVEILQKPLNQKNFRN